MPEQIVENPPQIDLSDQEIPEEIPILPLRDTVVFPNIVTPLIVAREKSVQLINDVTSGSRILGLASQRDVEIEEPGLDDIYKIGTAAVVLRMLKFPDGSLRVLVQGMERIRIKSLIQTDPYLVGNVSVIEETISNSTQLEALKRNVSIQFQKIV